MSEKTVRLLMVFAALFWSGAFVTGKIVVQEFPVFSLTFFRFLFALPFIFWILRVKEPLNWRPQGRQWVPLVVLGVVGTFLYHALFFTSLRYTTAINSSLIGATNPMVTTVLAVLFFHERLTAHRVIGIILSFSGVFLVITNADWQALRQFQFNSGDLIMFAAVCSWAIYSLLGRYYMKRYGLTPLVMTAYTFLVCVVFSIPFVLWERPGEFLPAISWGGWAAVLYMSLFSSVLGYLFQLIAIQRIGAARSAAFINLVPVFTIVQSVLLLGESVGPYKLLGAAFSMAGVYLATRPEPEKPLGKNAGPKSD